MSDLLERLRCYNPPDRTIGGLRQISVDIHDAAARIAALEAALRRAADTLDDIRRMAAVLNRPLLVQACEIAVTASRAALLPKEDST